MLEFVSERIKKVREERGISQKKLGMVLGLSDKAISAYEKGRTYPPIDTLFKIAQELKKPITYFLSEDSEEQDMFDRIERVEELLQTVNDELVELKRYTLSKDPKRSNTPPEEPVIDDVVIVSPKDDL